MKYSKIVVLTAGLTALNLIVKEPVLMVASAVVVAVVVVAVFRNHGKQNGKH